MTAKSKKKIWHLYFYKILKLKLSKKGIIVQREVEVGRMPLRIDVLIIKKQNKTKQNNIPKIFNLTKSKYTILEYKSPDDKFNIENLEKLIVYGFLYKLKHKIIDRNEITLMAIISDKINKIEEYLKKYGQTIIKERNGIYKAEVGFVLYIIKLDELEAIKEYNEILIFGKRFDKKKIIINLFKTLKRKNREIIKITEDLHPKEFKEVMLIMTKAELKKFSKRMKKILLETWGPDLIFETFFSIPAVQKKSTNRLLKKIGPNQLVRKLGPNRIIQELGPNRIIQELVNSIGKEKVNELLKKVSKKKEAVK